jgi:hypothetical protein
MIKKFNNFLIKESSEIEEYNDIRDIFSDMTDDEFKLEVGKLFFNRAGMSWDNENTTYTIPGVKISLKKKLPSTKLTEDITLEVINSIGECLDRLGELGEVIIKEMNLNYTPSGDESSSYSFFKFDIYLLQTHKELEISDKPGFYEFMDSLRRSFNVYSNRVTNAFDVTQGKDEAILVPKEGVNSRQLLSATKSQLKKFFDPYYMSWRNRRSYEFDYDVKLVDNKIHLIYKQKFQLDVHNRRIQPEN